MTTLKLDKLFNILNEIPDVHDMVIKNKVLCVKTDSSDYVKVDFTNIGEPEGLKNAASEQVKFMADDMTLTDFGVKYKTIKTLSDSFNETVDFDETEELVGFFFDKVSYVSRIPIINNTYADEEFGELQQGEYLGSVTLPQKLFSKIKTIIDLYKSSPNLILKDDKLNIQVQTTDKQDKSDFEIADNIFEGKFDMTNDIRFQRILFLYNFESDVELTFIREENSDSLNVIATGTLKGVAVQYGFKTSLGGNLELDSILDTSGIDLNLGLNV